MSQPTLWAFDTETYLITDSDKAPKPVVCSWFKGTEGAFLTRPEDPQTLELWADPQAHFVGHNMAYDLCVMMRWHPQFIPFIVRAVNEGRVWDTQIRQQLIHLRNVGDRGFPTFISLSDLEKQYLNIDRSDDKKGQDVWRLKYGTLDGIPLEQWPEQAKKYALEDAVYTWSVFFQQGGPQGVFPTESLQNQAALSLSLTSCWGFYTNQDNVHKVKDRIDAKMETLKQQLDAFQIEVDVKKVRTRKGVREVSYEKKTMGIIGKGTNPALHHLVLQGWKAQQQDTLNKLAAANGVGVDMSVVELTDEVDLGLWLAQHKAQKWQYLPAFCWNEKGWNPRWFLDKCLKEIKPVPRSSKGPKVGENDISPIIEYVPILKTRADYKHQEKMIATYVLPYLDRATIHANFKPMVGTGRTACSGPNLQNLPERGGEGFRKSLWARPGYLLGTVDYSALELVTFAATIVQRYGRSSMADAINEGMDLHCMTASGIFDRPYEEIIANKSKQPYKDWRQGSKALNFGGLGGLGALAFQSYAKFTYGVDWSLEECKKRIKKWKDKWNEVKKYLGDNGELCDNTDGRVGDAVNNMGRIKANCIYTQLCNYPFQSLAADGVKASMWEIIKHQLLGWFWTDAADLHMLVAAYSDADKSALESGLYYNSPLRHSHIVNMIHDELVMEHPEALAEEGFALQKKIMVDTMALFTTGVQPSVEGELMRDWGH